MPRYIDAEVAEANFEKITGVGISFAGIPTADVVPVVHAHWIRKGGWSTSMECSNCGLIYEGKQDFTGTTYYSASDFCPKCGAKMDEEVQ